MNCDPREALKELLGIQDVAALLGVKRETVDLWRVRDRRGRVDVRPMPAPVVPNDTTTSSCPLWLKSDILEWAAATKRL